MEKSSVMLGLLIGQRIAGLRTKAKNIVGYSYNGIVLPKLPEWDRVAYPYATIALRNGLYYLFLTNFAMYTATGEIIATNNSSHKSDGIEWSEYTGGFLETHTVIWVNYDMYTEKDNGGTLYLAASDPIPVYA